MSKYHIFYGPSGNKPQQFTVEADEHEWVETKYGNPPLSLIKGGKEVARFSGFIGFTIQEAKPEIIVRYDDSPVRV